MTALFNRWLPALTLGVWSLILLHLSKPYGAFTAWMATWTPLFSGHVGSLLDRPFWLPMFLAALMLMLLSVVFLLFKVDTSCCQAAACSHPLSRFSTGKWLTFLILVVPVTLSARYSPQAASTSYTAEAVRNQGTTTDISLIPGLASKVEDRHFGGQKPKETAAAKTETAPTPAPADTSDPAAALALPLPTADPSTPASVTPVTASVTQPAVAPAANPLESYVQKTKEGYLEAEVLDLLYAAQDNTLRKVFEGRTVQLIGQIMPDPADVANSAEGKHRFKAVRMFMTCCAADARPVATSVEAGEVPKLPEMTWVKIVGKATFPVVNGRRAAVLAADKVEKTEPPADSMLY